MRVRPWLRALTDRLKFEMGGRDEADRAEYMAAVDRALEMDSEINALSFDEARARAEMLLTQTQTFDCASASSPFVTDLSDLDLTLQSLFQRFENIRVRGDTPFLSRASVAPFGPITLVGGQSVEEYLFWHIGCGYKGIPVLVRPRQAGVYANLAGDPVDVGDELSDESDYPTVNHWLLMVGSGVKFPGV